MKFDAGRTMDEKVLKEIRKELEIVGRPKADADPGQLSAVTDWWSNYTASLRTKLTEVMLKHQIPIAWKQLENGDYVFEVKPKVYDVHEVSDEGVVSPKSHKVTGPDSNGVIVKLTYITPKLVSCQPQAKYGKIENRYWTRYFERQDDFPTVRFEMLYGKSTDRKLLSEIVDTFHTLSDAPSRF